MKILMAEHTYYRSLFQVGSHHLARGLASRGHEVTYISSYISPFHFLHFLTGRHKDIFIRLTNYLKGGNQEQKNLFSYVPLTFSPLIKLPKFNEVRAAYRGAEWTCPNLFKKLNPSKKYDALLIGDPRFVPLIGKIKADKIILRLTDNLTEFSQAPPALSELIKIGIQKADRVVVTAKPLIRIIEKKYQAQQVNYIPNGVNCKHFLGKHPLPPDLKNIPKPRVTYVGAIENWFDSNLLVQVAKNMPQVSFVIIGPVRTNIKKPENLTNVYFLGPRPYNSLPKYLKASQAGAIFFKKTSLVESVSPLKLYEYLAAGLPVVSIKWRELALLNSPAKLVSSKEEFIKALEKVLLIASPNNKLYKDFAKKNSWDKRVEAIEKLLS